MTATTTRPTNPESQPPVAGQIPPTLPEFDLPPEQPIAEALPGAQASGTRLHPLLGHLPLGHLLEVHRKRRAAGEQVAAHTAAREANDPAADYQKITNYLRTTGGIAIEAARSPLTVVSPISLVPRVIKGMIGRNEQHPEEAREFVAATKRHLGAIATRSADKTSAWIVDKVHDVDWWALAKHATESEEINTLVTVSLAAGPYGRAAKAAYLALEAAVAYHEAPENGHGRIPAAFGKLVSRELHRRLKGTKYAEGQAVVQEMLRFAAQQRAAKAARQDG